MTVPLLSTRTTNVELTPKRRDLLKGKLFPLTRYIAHTSIAYFDVVVRYEKTKTDGDQYIVSVKLSTNNNRYVAISVEQNLTKAILQARDTIKRQLSDQRTKARRIKSDWSFRPIQIV